MRLLATLVLAVFLSFTPSYAMDNRVENPPPSTLLAQENIWSRHQIVSGVTLTPVQWDDIRILPGSFDRPGVSDPAMVPYVYSGTTTYLWEFSAGDIASFTVQIPHGYSGTSMYVHIHWTPGNRGDEEIGKSVGWKVDWTWANINGTFGAMQTADLQDVSDGTDHKHQMTSEVLVGSGPGKGISSMLLCNVKRTDTGTDDTWASANSGELPFLLEIDFHYPIDTVGSREASSK